VAEESQQEVFQVSQELIQVKEQLKFFKDHSQRLIEQLKEEQDSHKT